MASVPPALGQCDLDPVGPLVDAQELVKALVLRGEMIQETMMPTFASSPPPCLAMATSTGWNSPFLQDSLYYLLRSVLSCLTSIQRCSARAALDLCCSFREVLSSWAACRALFLLSSRYHLLPNAVPFKLKDPQRSRRAPSAQRPRHPSRPCSLSISASRRCWHQ